MTDLKKLKEDADKQFRAMRRVIVIEFLVALVLAVSLLVAVLT